MHARTSADDAAHGNHVPGGACWLELCALLQGASFPVAERCPCKLLRAGQGYCTGSWSSHCACVHVRHPAWDACCQEGHRLTWKNLHLPLLPHLKKALEAP